MTVNAIISALAVRRHRLCVFSRARTLKRAAPLTCDHSWHQLSLPKRTPARRAAAARADPPGRPTAPAHLPSPRQTATLPFAPPAASVASQGAHTAKACLHLVTPARSPDGGRSDLPKLPQALEPRAESQAPPGSARPPNSNACNRGAHRADGLSVRGLRRGARACGNDACGGARAGWGWCFELCCAPHGGNAEALFGPGRCAQKRGVSTAGGGGYGGSGCTWLSMPLGSGRAGGWAGATARVSQLF